MTMTLSVIDTEIFEKVIDVIKDITEDERLPVEMKNEIETRMNDIVSELQVSR